MSELTRRRFLTLAGSVIGTVGIALPGAATAAGDDGAAELAGVARRARSARAVGRAYLEATPEERCADVLTTKISERLPDGGRAIRGAGDEALRRQLHSAIARDFADERVVRVRGFILSRTEARLCALTTLALDV